MNISNQITKLALALFLTFIISTSYAKTYKVTNTNNSGSGSLREAIINAKAGDEIRLAKSLLNSGTDTIKLTSELRVREGIKIVGVYNSSDTIFISGNKTNRIFDCALTNSSNKNLILDSLVLVDGQSSNPAPQGGAVQIYDFDSLFVYNSVFRNNRAGQHGGAIWAFDYQVANAYVNVTIDNCVFDNNYAWNDGGAIYSKADTDGDGSYTTLLISNSVFKNNTANLEEGAIYCYADGSTRATTIFKLINSEVQHNSSKQVGGILCSSGAQSRCSTEILVKNSIISHNESSNGGSGISCGAGGKTSYCDLNIIDSKVENNVAGNSIGGGIDCHVGTSGALQKIVATVKNSSISFNSTSNNGGAISLSGYDVSLHSVGSCWSKNSANGDGGIIYSVANRKNFIFEQSTLCDNRAGRKAGGIYAWALKGGIGNPVENHLFKNSTVYNNSSPISGNALYLESGSAPTPTTDIQISGSIFSFNGGNSLYRQHGSGIKSNGYNIFNEKLTGAHSSDKQISDSTKLKLLPLDLYGGTTPTRMPNIGSIAIDNGDPNDKTDAQNGPIVGVRDIGAAEKTCNSFTHEVITDCDSIKLPNGSYTNIPGLYKDTLVNSQKCDSIIILEYIRPVSYAYIKEFACGPYVGPSGKVYQFGGSFIDTIPNSSGCDSLINLDLVVVSIDTSVVFVQSARRLVSSQLNADYQWLDCDNGNSPIAGETGRYFDAKKDGRYAVRIKKDSCIDTSNCHTVKSTSTLQLSIPKTIEVYPNPSDGRIKLKLSESLELVQLRVSTIQGKVLYESNSKEILNNYIDLNIPKGTYLLEVVHSKGSEVIRILID